MAMMVFVNSARKYSKPIRQKDTKDLVVRKGLGCESCI